MISARVLDVRRISSALWRIDVELLEEVRVKPRPFTFAMVWVPRVDEIPLSISLFRNGVASFVFRIRGEGTKALASAPKGSFLGLKLPLGKGYVPQRGEKILAVAGGVGIAPIPLLIEFCKEVGCYVDVVWGVRSRDELCEATELGMEGASIYVATEDGSRGFKGTAIDLALEVLKNRRYDTVIAVGPKPMLKSFCGSLKGSGLRALVSLETMVKCGLGICGSCCVKPLPKLLCVDGPVFECSEVVEFLELSSD